MSKFKVGDKVRVTNTKYDFKKKHIGKTAIITTLNPNGEHVSYYNEPHYGFDCGVFGGLIMMESELELVKPKFDIKKYKGKYAMRCRTKEAIDIFLKYLDSVGERWLSGHKYTEWRPTMFKTFDEGILYFNNGTYSSLNKPDRDFNLLEFDNFDWSDFMCKKEKAFTKSDLRNGDVVKKRNGDVEIVCVDTNTLICSKCGYNSLNSYKEDLTYGGYGACLNNPYDIIKVLRPQDPSDCRFDAFHFRECGKLVYERKEVEEMTLEEVCKALGKEIKIVKK